MFPSPPVASCGAALCDVSINEFYIQAEAAQQAADQKAQAEAQEAQLHSLRVQLAEHKQAGKQQPWTGTGSGTGRLVLPLPGMLTHTGRFCDKLLGSELTKPCPASNRLCDFSDSARPVLMHCC